MSEQELDEIVQITVEDFNEDDHTSMFPERFKHYFPNSIIYYYLMLDSLPHLLHEHNFIIFDLHQELVFLTFVRKSNITRKLF